MTDIFELGTPYFHGPVFTETGYRYLFDAEGKKLLQTSNLFVHLRNDENYIKNEDQIKAYTANDQTFDYIVNAINSYEAQKARIVELEAALKSFEEESKGLNWVWAAVQNTLRASQ